MFAILAALAVIVGAVVGMLGGGGAILMVPLLVYVARMEPRNAIAASLFVVGTTSIVGATVHARAGNVRWKEAGIFGAAAMVGAFAGGRLAQLVPGALLLILFGAVMILTSIGMLRPRTEMRPVRAAARWKLALVGVAVGTLAGLIGAGGGFLIVPALTMFGGLAMRESVGTSLVVISLQSFAGFVGHATHAHLDWLLVAAIAVAAAGGSIGGAIAAKRVAPVHLRRAFAVLVLGMGLFVLVRNVIPNTQ